MTAQSLRVVGDPLPNFPAAPATAAEARQNFECARTDMRSQSWRGCVSAWMKAEEEGKAPTGWRAGAHRGAVVSRPACRGCRAGERRHELLGEPDLRKFQAPKKRTGDTPDGQPDAQVRALLVQIEERHAAPVRRRPGRPTHIHRPPGRRATPTTTATAEPLPAPAVTEPEIAALLAPAPDEEVETMTTTATASTTTATGAPSTEATAEDIAATCVCARCERPLVWRSGKPPEDDRLKPFCGRCIYVATKRTPILSEDRAGAMAEYLRTHPSILVPRPAAEALSTTTATAREVERDAPRKEPDVTPTPEPPTQEAAEAKLRTLAAQLSMNGVKLRQLREERASILAELRAATKALETEVAA